MNKTLRPSANKTREKILVAAKEHFLAKGFEATFIKDIAKSAGTNTNLIFHHFDNKEGLWLRVKESILNNTPTQPTYDTSSAQNYFSSLLDYRFELYSQHPDLVRLIQWQQLTDNENDLIGDHQSSPNHWLKTIRKFQRAGEITKEVDAKQIMLFVIFSTHAPFLQKVIPLNKKQTEQYKQLILDMCCLKFLTI
jgi:AcrR family transcriptional regulator